MDTLPPELLGPIFLLACTDGGRTGCSLSRTSKYLRAASRQARFHSVALVSSDPSQIAQFLSCFSAEWERAPQSRPRVRHLCLSSARQQQLSADPSHDGEMNAEYREPDSRHQDTVSQKQAQRYFRDVMSLIQMLAPDLETLCLIDPEQQGTDALHFPTLRIAGFPSLVELAIIGKEPTIEATSDACTPFYPRLRTIHRIFLPRILRLHQFADSKELLSRVWKKRAPGVVNVRVLHMSGLRFGASIAEILHRVLREQRVRLSWTLTELFVSSSRRRRRLSVSSDPRG